MGGPVTRVVIADDEEAIRHGFRLMLDAQPDMQVVGEAPNGETALALAHRVRPDVVLADIRMPRLDGLELTRRLAGPDVADPIRVIVVTTFDLDEYVHAALRNGACGFLLKRGGPALLAEAVRAAMAGDVLISPSVTVRLLRHLTEPRPAGPHDRSSHSLPENSTSPGSSRTATPTLRSPPSCSSRPAPPRPTSPTSSASSTSATASASPPGPGTPALLAPDRPQTTRPAS
jgi:DNA-binding NarL/FixJ family response regulator